MRKGQAAMEFLMTYGWAILVVLVAIGALAYFGVLSPAKFLPEKCILSSGQGLFCSGFGVDSTADTISIKVTNSLDEDLSVAADGLSIKQGLISCTGPTAVTSITKSADTTLIAITCDGVIDLEKINADIVIKATSGTGAGALTKVITGSLVARGIKD